MSASRSSCIHLLRIYWHAPLNLQVIMAMISFTTLSSVDFRSVALQQALYGCL